MSSVNAIDRFWTTDIASSTTARSLTIPKRSTRASQSLLSAIALDGATEERDVAAVGKDRAGHEVDEYLGGHLVEAEDRHLLARADHEPFDAERAQAPVVLRDAGELENGAAHAPRSRLSSSTTRLDSASASISIFAAARLHAIAP